MMRITHVDGLDFGEHDSYTSILVASATEILARKLLNGASPIGRRFWIETTPNEPQSSFEIIGVAKDTKYRDLRDNFGPIAFLAVAQDPHPPSRGQFLIRSTLPEGEITTSVKRLLNEINPAIDISFQGFQKMIEDSTLRDRLMATLSGFF